VPNMGRIAKLLAMLLFGWTVPGGAPGGAPNPGPGTIRLTFTAPDEGTALIEISRAASPAPQHTVVHGPGDDDSVDIEVQPGTYRIMPRPMFVNDQRYVAKSDPVLVRVKSGNVRTSNVVYRWSKGVQNLRATAVTATSISLDWDAELGHGTTVWRTNGDDPPVRPGVGTLVTVGGSSLVDTGLTPGATFSYSIFALPGDAGFGLNHGDPVTITVGTASDGATSSQPLFVLNPRASVLSTDDFVAATPTGDGVRLDLRPGFATPVPGAILALPVTPSLLGGYLGEVTSVSADGRTVWLTVAAMAAAFDLYDLTVTTFADPAVATQAVPLSSESQSVPAANPGMSSEPAAPQAPDEETQAQMSRTGEAQPDAFLQAPFAASALVECNLATNIDVTPAVSMSHAGHAHVTIDKYKVKFFPDVPTGVSIDIGYSATLSGTVDIEAGQAAECGLPLPNFYKQITLYPVPIGLDVRPEVEVSVSAKGSVTNLGFAATAGFEVDGHMGFTGGNSFDGNIINTSSPTQPTASGSLELGLDIGGKVAFGPGIGSSEAGVVVGVGGDLYVVDASVGVTTVNDGTNASTCIELSAATRMGISASLRAWVPGYEADYSVSIDALQGEFPWGGSPWHWPDDCTESEIPTDDVVGDGVTVIDDDLVGSSEQWGKVDGFVPGEGTWVLSTGRIQEAVGQPSFFASTGLGQPGDSELSALSGFVTYDAAAYSVTVVPNGNTLHIKYAFASEEYPEYVGSSYNDVMAVFVDGQNCALVPGTLTPVSVNTINPGANSQYFVDNASGAAGYGTTMDGLTTPLVCSVPVTPGEHVVIKVAVADASDSIYDSAVALLDGGIWSE
jgi:hypothetical protein